MNKDYSSLFELSKKSHILKSILQLLEWDMETYMPKKGYMFRSQQIEALSSSIHKEKTSAKFQKSLEKLIDLDSGAVLIADLSFSEKRCVKLWRRDFLKERLLPEKFVKKFSKLTAEAMNVWGQAKKGNQFSLFSPYLEKIVAMSQEKISYLGFDDHPYDALLDDFDPDRKTKELELLFSEIVNFVPNFIKNLKPIDDHFLTQTFNEEEQLDFGKEILKIIHFDSERGRLDISNHPFSSTLHPSDSRITTRIKKDSLMESISAVIHEAGHSFYDMGMDPQYFGSPQAEPISMTIHESQSRLWETCIGQGEPFWKLLYPLLQKKFPKQLSSISFDLFYKAINKINKTPIRIEADEVSYPLHVIVRFEIEKALITDALKVKDLPSCWNDLMEKIVGVTPKNDAEGCLQDIHWSMGAFGYFPSYALGNLYAASFFEGYKKHNVQWAHDIEKGDFSSLKDFLHSNLYQYGRIYSGDEILHKISGEKLSTKPYITYLKDKYNAIYSE